MEEKNYILIEPIPFEGKEREYLVKFLDYCYEVLALQNTEPVEFTFVSDKTASENGMTTGCLEPSSSKAAIRFENRALIDINRSIAHELVHKKQFTLPDVDRQYTPQSLEDQANAIAGRIVRAFGNKFPEAYNSAKLLEFIRKRGDKFVVVSHKGKTLGTHDTRGEALAQPRAIEANKHHESLDEDVIFPDYKHITFNIQDEGMFKAAYPISDIEIGDKAMDKAFWTSALRFRVKKYPDINEGYPVLELHIDLHPDIQGKGLAATLIKAFLYREGGVFYLSYGRIINPAVHKVIEKLKADPTLSVVEYPKFGVTIEEK